MNIDVNPLAKGSGYKKSASIAIMAVLIFSAVGIVAYTPKSAAAAVTITTSSSQFYGPALERVLITDTSKDTGTDTITPHVAVKRGSTTLFEKDVIIPIIGTSGTFEFFLTTSNSPFSPASPSFTAGAPIIIRISQTPTISGATEASFSNIPAEYSFPISPTSAPLKDGDTIVVTYGGQTSTVQFAKANVVSTVDRTVAGSGDKVTVTLNDQNGNLDPTSVDNFTASSAVVTAVGGVLNLANATFIEEGQNNGAFDLVVNVTSTNSTNPTNGGTLGNASFPGTAQFTLHGFDVYSNTPASATAPYNAAIPNPSVTSSQTVSLLNTDGVLSLQKPVTIGNGIQIQVADQDRNLDTKTKDTFNSLINVTITGIVGFDANVPMKETDFNSGIFLPDTTNNKIPISVVTGPSFIDSTGIHINATDLAANDNLNIVYTDPAADPTGSQTFQQVTTIGHVVGSINAPSTTVSLNSKFTLGITDSDLNLNPNTADSFTVTFPAGLASDQENAGQFFQSGLSSLTLKVAGVPVTFTTPMQVTFIETGANTGAFTATNVDMKLINAAYSTAHGTMKDGDQVEFKLHDHSENPVQTSTVTITVGNPPITVDTDRTTIPNPAGGAGVKFTISVTDQTLNTNPTSIDSPTLGSAAANGNNPSLIVSITNSAGSPITPTIPGLVTTGVLGPQVFTETGTATGVFTYQYVLGAYAGTPSDINNAKIKFTYSSGGTTSSISVTMRTYDGAVSSSSSVVKNGDTITVTVTDPDLNKDNTIAEQATVTLHTSDDTVQTPDVSISNLQETGVDTGIFTKSVVIGKDVRVGDLTTNNFATTLEIHYPDALASDSSPNVDRELDLKVGTQTGSVTITPTIVGPGTKVSVDVHDNDLNVNPQGVDLTSNNIDYLRITSDATNAKVLSSGIQGEETGPNTGIFHTKLTLIPAASTVASGVFTASGKEMTGTVLPGDTISLRYTDQKDAQGNKVTVATTFKVQSFDPVMKIDKTSVGAGDSFMLTISDPDANRDGEAVDSVPIRAYSTSDAVGITLSALETGANTGNFTVSIPTTTGVSAGSVSVKTGDTLTVKYNDLYPADFAARVKQVVDSSKDFFFNVNIGTGQGGQGSNSTSVSNPETRNVNNQVQTQVTAGQQIVLATTVNNNNPVTQPYAVIVEVRDADGITVYLQWQTGTLPIGGNTGVGLSWTPDQAGTYTVRTFVVSDIANPQVLSQLASSTVTVV